MDRFRFDSTSEEKFLPIINIITEYNELNELQDNNYN